MKPAALSPQRLNRLSLWLCLTLALFVAHVVTKIAPRIAARELAHYARAALLIVMARALNATTLPPRRRAQPGEVRRRLSRRAAAGARLRRALRAKTPQARAHAIASILTAPERWVARIARRLARGFTRLRALPKPPRRMALFTDVAPRTAAAPNSS